MAGQDRMTIEEVVKKVLRDEHADVIRESVKTIARELMEAEVSELIGAELGERRPDDRATQRNGYRPRRWDTRAGEIELQIPKLRQGSYFPSFLQPRKRSEQALVSVVQQAYVCGVSTRRVDQLVESLGLPRDVRKRDDRVEHRPLRRAERGGGGVEHALEDPQRRVPELLGAAGGATNRVRGSPAPRDRKAEPEHRKVTRHATAVCRGGTDRARPTQARGWQASSALRCHTGHSDVTGARRAAPSYVVSSARACPARPFVSGEHPPEWPGVNF